MQVVYSISDLTVWPWTGIAAVSRNDCYIVGVASSTDMGYAMLTCVLKSNQSVNMSASFVTQRDVPHAPAA